MDACLEKKEFFSDFDMKFRIEWMFIPVVSCKENDLDMVHISGWCHDEDLYIEKNGKMKVQRKGEKQDCYFAKIDSAGKIFEKTFFPSSWKKEKVVKKVREGCGNIQHVQKNGNLWTVFGKTSEGIIIKYIMLVDVDGIEVLSACPDKKWILG